MAHVLIVNPIYDGREEPHTAIAFEQWALEYLHNMLTYYNDLQQYCLEKEIEKGTDGWFNPAFQKFLNAEIIGAKPR